MLPLDGEDPQLLVGTPDEERSPRFAPNGRHVAYRSQDQIWIVDTQDPDTRWQVTLDGGRSQRWTADGRLFYESGGKLMVVTIDLEPVFRVVSRDTFFELGDLSAQFDISSDGRTFVAYRRLGWVPLELVTNWSEKLRATMGN